MSKPEIESNLAQDMIDVSYEMYVNGTISKEEYKDFLFVLELLMPR